MQLSRTDGPQPDPARRWGFRFSRMDAVVVAVLAVATVSLRSAGVALWWVAPMVLGHFFLFCNVFLVWQRWEMIWAALFIVNVVLHLAMGGASWGSVLLWQLPCTAAVIGLQMRSPWYHGIFAPRINPRLDGYLRGGR